VGLSVVGCNQVTGDGPPTVELEANVHEGGLSFFDPLEGVELCEVDITNLGVEVVDDNCETTDDKGFAAIRLPENANVTWSLRKDGYQSVLVPDVTDAFYDPATVWPLFTDANLAELCQALPAEVDCEYPLDGTGHGWISVFTRPRREGATFTLVGATGHVIYHGSSGELDPDLEATSTNGDALIIDVLPGDVKIRFGGSAEGCTARQSWPVAENDMIAAPVREGFHTYAGLNCEGVAP